MAINSGVNISKAVGFAVLERPPGVTISKAVGFAVLQDANVPVWPIVTPPGGTIGLAYSWVFTTTGATTTTFTLTSGSLPPGLSLSNVSGNTGQVTGTPTTAGSYSFTLLATNSAGTASQSFTIAIAAPAQRGNIDYDQVRLSARQGSGGLFQMFGGGTPVAGHLAVYDSIGNVIDGGSAAAGLLPIRTVSADVTLTAADYTVVATATPLTVTLPTAPATGKLLNVKNGNPTVGQIITITTTGGVLIDTSSSVTLGATASLSLQFDGTQWRIL